MVSFEYLKTCPHPVAHWQVEAEEEEISCLEINCNFSSLVHDPDLQQFLHTANLLNSCSDMMCKNENSQKKGRWQKDARLVANGPWPGLHLEMVLAQLTSSLLWHLAFPTMCQYHSPTRVEICRDRHNRRLCKICASCVNFPGKQRDFSHNLRRTSRFTHTKCDFALKLLNFTLLVKF